MLYADVQSIFEPVDQQYKQKMKKMKTGKKKSKTPYTEKINTHVLSGWSVHITFGYGDVPDPLKMYHCKACMENTGDEVKQLCAKSPQRSVTEITDIMKR